MGSSVHNQPIEQAWGDVKTKVILPVKLEFEKLAKQGALDTDNQTDLTCMHYVFLPLIQVNLTRYVWIIQK